MTQPPWPPPWQGPQHYPGVPPPRAKNGAGVTSLVLGIISLVLCWLPLVGLGLGIGAVATGAVGRGRFKRGEAIDNGPAVTGMVLGIVATIVGIAILLLVFLIAFLHQDCMEHAQYPYQRKGC
jgi:hypothetical protein